MVRLTPLAALLTFASMAAVAAPAPAPLADYAKLEAMSDVQLSQDGQRIAYIAGAGDDHSFMIQQVGGPILQAIPANKHKIMFIQFADPDHVLMGIRGTEHFGDASETYELSAVFLYNLKTKHGAQIFPKDGLHLQSRVGFTHEGDHLYLYFMGADEASTAGNRVTAASEGRGSRGLYKMDLDTLSSTLVVASKGEGEDFAIGPDGEILARVATTDYGKSWQILKGEHGGQVLVSGKTEWDSPSVAAYGHSKTSVIVTLTDDGEYDPPHELDLTTGKVSAPLIDGAEASVLRDRGSRLAIGYYAAGFVNDALFEDPAVEAQWKSVQATFPDELVSLVSYDNDFDRWVVHVEGAHDSGRYFLVDLKSSKAILLGADHPQIAPAQVASFSWFDYTAQDGTKLRGVLTLPPGRDPKNLPLVMMPHGGPGNGIYDKPDFDWWAQAIASRGYAVFKPDYRGSGGLGRTFERVGWGQWGRLMETDVSDAIPALAAKGIIDPKRACIVGWSYGGYATLAGVTLQKGFYRCAVAGGAVSDLNDMEWWSHERAGNYQDPSVRYWNLAMGLKGAGDPEGAKWSPAKHAADADAPILLIHGKDDTVVPFRQATEMADALRAAHKTVDVLTLPTSDHWIGAGSEANRAAMLEGMVNWLEKYNPPD